MTVILYLNDSGGKSHPLGTCSYRVGGILDIGSEHHITASQEGRASNSEVGVWACHTAVSSRAIRKHRVFWEGQLYSMPWIWLQRMTLATSAPHLSTVRVSVRYHDGRGQTFAELCLTS